MILAITNQKGGTAKTTTAVNLSAAVAERGLRVLLVDADPQGNATVALGVDAERVAFTLADVLGGAPITEACLTSLTSQACLTSQTRLFLLPSHPDAVGAAAARLSAERGDQLILREALSPLANDFACILIDCPPSLSLLTIAALIAADQVLVPTPTEFLSLEGVAQLLDTVDVIRDRFNPHLSVMGLLPVRHEARPRGSQAVLERLHQFGVPVLRTIIRKNVHLSDAAGAGQPVIEYDSASRGAEDHRALAEEVLALVSEARPTGV